MDRPLTQREIKNKKSSKEREPRATVENLTKRTLILQLRDKNSDFYIGEKSIYVGPRKTFTERVSLFNPDQISNLRAKGEIRVVGNVV